MTNNNSKRITKKAQYQIERLARLRKALPIVKAGICPDCGAPLHRNNSLAGWFQCAAYPCLAMRRAGFENLAKCDFQIFFEPTAEENAALIADALTTYALSELERLAASS